MPDTETMLPVQVSDLSYHAGGRTLINQVDLKIASNGITVIMGPNGAGKSLLLRLLHGLLPPTSGSIHWDGKPMADAHRRRQAMVFQRPYFCGAQLPRISNSLSTFTEIWIRRVGTPSSPRSIC